MTFEDLESWQQARQLTRQIYVLTRNHPLVKDFGMCDQMQRAAVSVMSNIAEGFERLHVPEKLQVYNVARGSSAEVRSLLYVVEDNYPGAASEAVRLRDHVAGVGKLLTGLIQSTESRRSKLTRLLTSIVHLLSPV